MFVRLMSCLSIVLLAVGCAAPPSPTVAEREPEPIPDRAPAPPPQPTPAPLVDPAPEPEPVPVARDPEPISHAGIGAAVVVSSTQREDPAEGPPEALVDGDLATRWSSAYDEPQQVVVSLPEPRTITAVQLHWEAASAQRYTLSVTPDGHDWVEVATIETEDPGPRVDNLELDGEPISGVRLDLLQRVNPEWGFSLYQVALLDER